MSIQLLKKGDTFIVSEYPNVQFKVIRKSSGIVFFTNGQRAFSTLDDKEVERI